MADKPKVPRGYALPLVLTPLLLYAGARVSEHATFRAQMDHLERVPFMIDPDVAASCAEAAAREGVIIGRIDIRGATALRTGSTPLDADEARLPAWGARDEVRAALAGNRTFGRYETPDGTGVLLTLAQARPDGAVLYLLTGYRRTFLGRLSVLSVIGWTVVVGVSLGIARSRRRDTRREGTT